MSWRVSIQPKAEEHLAWFRQRDRKLYVKCFDLIRAIAIDPRRGIGKPERLRFFNEEVWSRRVSQEHRLVYVIEEKQHEVAIISCKSHYENIRLR